MIQFVVYGLPIGKARPKFARLPNGSVRTYTPKKTGSWEDNIRLQALEHRPAQLLDGPLAARITFYLPRPKSAPRRVTMPATKPDLDNLAKAVFDALEGIIYINDSRFVRKDLAKKFGDPPRVEVEIREAV